MLTEAVGINPEASRLAGVRSRGIVFGAYVASATARRASPASSTARTSWPPTRTPPASCIELYAILAVVLGGTSLLGGKFSIAGTVIGVLIIQTLKSTILFLGVPSAEAPVFFAVVVIIVVLDPVAAGPPDRHDASSRRARTEGRQSRAETEKVAA